MKRSLWWTLLEMCLITFFYQGWHFQKCGMVIFTAIVWVTVRKNFKIKSIYIGLKLTSKLDLTSFFLKKLGSIFGRPNWLNRTKIHLGATLTMSLLEIKDLLTLLLILINFTYISIFKTKLITFLFLFHFQKPLMRPKTCSFSILNSTGKILNIVFIF